MSRSATCLCRRRDSRLQRGPGRLVTPAGPSGGTLVQLTGADLPLADPSAEDQLVSIYGAFFGLVAHPDGLAIWAGRFATARAVLATHTPAVRMGIVSRLPGIESVRIATPADFRPSPLEVCDAIIMTFVEARGVVLRDAPAAAA